jgi:hypothetical protein
VSAGLGAVGTGMGACPCLGGVLGSPATNCSWAVAKPGQPVAHAGTGTVLQCVCADERPSIEGRVGPHSKRLQQQGRGVERV